MNEAFGTASAIVLVVITVAIASNPAQDGELSLKENR